MRITFLEEPPYINLAPPDPVSGRCSLDRGVICRVAPEVEVAGSVFTIIDLFFSNYE